MEEKANTKRESYIIIPNSFIWCNTKEEVSLINGLDSKCIAVMSYIKKQSNVYDECCFTLEWLIKSFNIKPDRNKGKSNEQFKNCLLKLVEVGLVEDIDDTIKNCKINTGIMCKLNIPKIDKEWFRLDYQKIKEISTIKEGDKITLINIYSYVLSRLYRRKDSSEIHKDGGHSECFYDSQENISEDLGISKNTFIKHMNILIENKLIYSGNLGKVYNKNKGCYNMSNVYVIDEEELEQGLIDCAYKLMKEGNKILGTKQSDESFKINGLKGKIKTEEAKGNNTDKLKCKLKEDVDKNVKLTKKENKCLKKAKADIGNNGKNETIKQLTINDVLDEIACGNVKLEDVSINKINFKNKGNYLGNNKKRCGYG